MKRFEKGELDLGEDKKGREEQAVNGKKTKIRVSSAGRGIDTADYYFIKWLAVITMLIDHITVQFYDVVNLTTAQYAYGRIIGRLAFPLFCYLLVESFYFTKNKGKHLRNIVLVGVLSEVQFDLIITGKFFSMKNQNVCLSLALGFAMLWVKHSKISDKLQPFCPKKWQAKTVSFFFKAICICGAGYAAFKFKTDFSYYGIMLIFFLDLARNTKYQRLGQFFAISIFVWSFLMADTHGSNLIYFICYFDLIPIWIVSSEAVRAIRAGREKRPIFERALISKPSKITCRLFYPVHILILVLIRYFIFGTVSAAC